MHSPLQLIVAAVTSYALLKLSVRRMLEQLGKNGLAMARCRAPTQSLENGHFPPKQIQIVPHPNRCRPFVNNSLPGRGQLFPRTAALPFLVRSSVETDTVRLGIDVENIVPVPTLRVRVIL